MLILDDRRHAGRLLGASARTQMLTRGADLVLALPRGGVPVGWEVARELALPLDVFVARKIRVDRHPGTPIGAIASGGALILDPALIADLDVSRADVERAAEDARLELERTEAIHRRARDLLPVEGRSVLLVDDGFTDADTVELVLASLEKLGAARVAFALPAATPDVAAIARAHGVSLLQLATDGEGVWFEDASQPGDHEIRVFLDGSRALTSAPPPPSPTDRAAAA